MGSPITRGWRIGQAIDLSDTETYDPPFAAFMVASEGNLVISGRVNTNTGPVTIYANAGQIYEIEVGRFWETDSDATGVVALIKA